jgi:hypothetical protein
MEISITVNGTMKIAMTPKTEVMKYMAELIKDEATFVVSRPNNSSEIVFTLVKERAITEPK